MVAGCDDGIFEPIDYAKLNLDKDDYLPDALLDCGVGSVSWSEVFGYDVEQIKGEGPKDWRDFWDTKKFPGKRGMKKSPLANLEFALMADGVAPADVYSILRTPEGKDRAFKKLDEIKPHVVWWERNTQATQLLADKEVVMTAGSSGRFATAITDEKRNFKIVWDGQIMDYEYWSIPKDHPQTDLAYSFIAFASRPERIADQTNYIPYGPLRKSAAPLVKPEVAEYLPTSPANMKAALKTDTQFWADNSADLNQRFQAWVAQ